MKIIHLSSAEQDLCNTFVLCDSRLKNRFSENGAKAEFEAYCTVWLPSFH